MSTPLSSARILDLIARYHHLLSLETARLVPIGYTESWVNQLDELSWAIVHEYLDRHAELAKGAADDLKGEDPIQPPTPTTDKAVR